MDGFYRTVICIRCEKKYPADMDVCPRCDIVEETPGEKEINKILKVLSNPKRRDIIKQLVQGQKSRRELADIIGVTIEMTTRYCNHLLGINVIAEEPAKKEDKGGYITKYSINADRLRKVLKEVNEYIMFTSFSKGDTLDSNLTIFANHTAKTLEGNSWAVIDSCEYDGMTYSIDKFPITIGRDNQDYGIRLPFDGYVSNPHAQVSYNEKQDKYYLRDLGSRNHTIIGEKTLSRNETEIRNGDRFKVGKTWIKFVAKVSNDKE